MPHLRLPIQGGTVGTHPTLPSMWRQKRAPPTQAYLILRRMCANKNVSRGTIQEKFEPCCLFLSSAQAALAFIKTLQPIF
jgi:hypothetical protein